MKFISEMWHPNSRAVCASCLVYADGRVCISILHSPGLDPLNPDERAEERWRPILSAEAIIISVQSLLNDPNLSSPANVEAGKQYRDSFKEYKKKVIRLAALTASSL